MSPPLADSVTLTTLRSDLEAIAGVRRAWIAGPPWSVGLICDSGVQNSAVVTLAARAVVHRHWPAVEGVDIEVGFATAPPPEYRVKYLGCEIQNLGPTRAAAEVRLQWNGSTIAERSEGERGPIATLRLPALATLQALDRVVDGAVRFQLVGVKLLRVFDGDLVVMLLRSERALHRQLTGACLVTEDIHRSASLAVLQATNGILGNYLALQEAETER